MLLFLALLAALEVLGKAKTLKRVSTEMSLHVLAYNLKRVMKILGPAVVVAQMRG